MDNRENKINWHGNSERIFAYGQLEQEDEALRRRPDLDEGRGGLDDSGPCPRTLACTQVIAGMRGDEQKLRNQGVQSAALPVLAGDHPGLLFYNAPILLPTSHCHSFWDVFGPE